jgi:hypothetical protein
MVQAAVDRILAKTRDYEDWNLHMLHALDELHLICHYSYQAVLYNTPLGGSDFDFAAIAARVSGTLAKDHEVFDRIFFQSLPGSKGYTGLSRSNQECWSRRKNA